MTDYTREKLIEICERAIVSEERWRNRDSYASQCGVGTAWALLKAGCKFRVRTAETLSKDAPCLTTPDTIWIDIEAEGFAFYEDGPKDSESYYLPSEDRLSDVAGGDWY